jgi:hypothetical protein
VRLRKCSPTTRPSPDLLARSPVPQEECRSDGTIRTFLQLFSRRSYQRVRLIHGRSAWEEPGRGAQDSSRRAIPLDLQLLPSTYSCHPCAKGAVRHIHH